MFESVMFPNNSADSVPAAYLAFLDDLLNVPEEGYNWGQVVLSCLYFNLCRSCLEPADCIEDPGTFGINSRICKTTASIGRRTVPTTMTYLGCTTCISICKFLKSIKYM
jgi:hypothetical protein